MCIQKETVIDSPCDSACGAKYSMKLGCDICLCSRVFAVAIGVAFVQLVWAFVQLYPTVVENL